MSTIASSSSSPSPRAARARSRSAIPFGQEPTPSFQATSSMFCIARPVSRPAFARSRRRASPPARSSARRPLGQPFASPRLDHRNRHGCGSRAAGEAARVEDPRTTSSGSSRSAYPDLPPAGDGEPGVHRVESYGAGVHLCRAPRPGGPHRRGRRDVCRVHARADAHRGALAQAARALARASARALGRGAGRRCRLRPDDARARGGGASRRRRRHGRGRFGGGARPEPDVLSRAGRGRRPPAARRGALGPPHRGDARPRRAQRVHVADRARCGRRGRSVTR